MMYEMCLETQQNPLSPETPLGGGGNFVVRDSARIFSEPVANQFGISARTQLALFVAVTIGPTLWVADTRDWRVWSRYRRRMNSLLG
jgi:hypothetical protein